MSDTADVKTLTWAANELGIGKSTAYRIAPLGEIPGAFKIGGQWRVSVPKFYQEVHGLTSIDLRSHIESTAEGIR